MLKAAIDFVWKTTWSKFLFSAAVLRKFSTLALYFLVLSGPSGEDRRMKDKDKFPPSLCGISNK